MIALQGHLKIARKAFPVILANATVPLLGLSDTAVIGQTGGARELGAIALGALVFSFLYWGFGFLRMATTGFVAQAYGAGDYKEVSQIGMRAGLMAVAIGAVLLMAQQGIAAIALYLLDGSAGVKDLVRQYFYVRIWGAPATLSRFVLFGLFIGLGETRKLLTLELSLNGANIVLNLFFVLQLGWGVRGVAAGTVIAEWLSFLLGIWMVHQSLRQRFPQYANRRFWRESLHKSKFVRMMQTNGNIMIRTLALLFGFAWFANQGAGFSDETLAANHILLQFVSLSAFFLDGYAYVVEMMVGKAIGARDVRIFRLQLKQANQLAGLTAFLLAALVAGVGTTAINGLTQDQAVRDIAHAFLPYAAGYILVSFYAFQLDGVFIGSALGKEMRNASVFSLLFFLTLCWLLAPRWANAGLWVAFTAYVIVRGLSLAYYRPRVDALFVPEAPPAKTGRT